MLVLKIKLYCCFIGVSLEYNCLKKRNNFYVLVKIQFFTVILQQK